MISSHYPSRQPGQPSRNLDQANPLNDESANVPDGTEEPA